MKITQFGDPVLRQKAMLVDLAQIKDSTTQKLINFLSTTLTIQKLGVGLAAPQVGINLAVAVVRIQPTKIRPEVEAFELNIINPKVTKTFGRKMQMWEGCISSGAGKAGLFAKVPRYKRIELEYYDENAKKHTKAFEGLPAHVIQHEVDHLNGILFVDRVVDSKTYMTYQAYKKAKVKNLLD
jgi:peptide deformylase